MYATLTESNGVLRNRGVGTKATRNPMSKGKDQMRDLDEENTELPTTLSFRDKGLAEMPVLGLESSGIRTLDFSFNKIYKMENLRHATGVVNLNFHFNCLTRIEGLDNLSRLQQLFINDNKITSLSLLHPCKQLKLLRADSNHIEKIEGLTNLQNLTFLDLSNNKIAKIEGLESLVRLEELHLSHNKIKKIENISHLSKTLDELQLSSNIIASGAGLKGLKNLQTLRLSDNCIADLATFPRLPLLSELYLSENDVSGIPAAVNTLTPQLSVLDLSSNQVFESDLESLAKLKKLTELTIRGNPVSSNDSYRRSVCALLPAGLQYLDDAEIIPGDRVPILPDPDPLDDETPRDPTVEDMDEYRKKMGIATPRNELYSDLGIVKPEMSQRDRLKQLFESAPKKDKAKEADASLKVAPVPVELGGPVKIMTLDDIETRRQDVLAARARMDETMSKVKEALHFPTVLDTPRQGAAVPALALGANTSLKSKEGADLHVTQSAPNSRPPTPRLDGNSGGSDSGVQQLHQPRPSSSSGVRFQHAANFAARFNKKDSDAEAPSAPISDRQPGNRPQKSVEVDDGPSVVYRGNERICVTPRANFVEPPSRPLSARRRPTEPPRVAEDASATTPADERGEAVQVVVSDAAARPAERVRESAKPKGAGYRSFKLPKNRGARLATAKKTVADES